MAPTEPIVSSMGEHPVRAHAHAYAHVPYLSYRNSMPSDDTCAGSRHSTTTTGPSMTRNTASTTSTVVTSPSDVESGPRSPGLPRLTLSPSVTSAPKSPSARSFAMSSTAHPAKTKKKSSFLGSLFTKEPSTDAFLQMQKQSLKQVAQNSGRKNPPGMSGVSSTKMPQDVPKVNSKWDGMPRRVNEGYDRRNSRISSCGHSTTASSTRSHSSGPSSCGRHSRGLSASTNSSNHPSQTRSGNGAHVVGSTESISTSSITKCPRPKSVSIHIQPLKSSSESSLPHLTSFSPNDILKSPGYPHVSGLQSRTEASLQCSSGRGTTNDIPRWEGYYAISGQTSSLGPSPSENSPITPSSHPLSLLHPRQPVVKDDNSFPFPPVDINVPELVFNSLHCNGLDHSITTRKEAQASARAFLADEARSLRLSDDDTRSLTPKSILKQDTTGQVFAPLIQIQHDLEKRPDSSRARLGLMASVTKTPNTAPWEWDDEKESRPVPSQRISSHKTLLPKTLGIFGKA